MPISVKRQCQRLPRRTHLLGLAFALSLLALVPALATAQAEPAPAQDGESPTQESPAAGAPAAPKTVEGPPAQAPSGSGRASTDAAAAEAASESDGDSGSSPEPGGESAADAAAAPDDELDTDSQAEAAEPPAPATPPAASGPAIPVTVCQGKTIGRIDVAGFGRVSAEDIRATISLRAGLPCTDAEVTRDARALWDLGYFSDVRVDASVAEDGKLALVFQVKERPAIGEVVFEGNDEVDKSDLDEKVTLRQGAVLSEPSVLKQVGKIKELYAEKGFFLAKISYELDPMPNDEVRVRFVIDEGEEVTVRRIRFLGNEQISAKEIRSFMQTGETSLFSLLSSNNTYRREVFDQDLNMIQALYYDRGYLMVEVGDPHIELTPDRKHIDLTIRVKEGPRFKVGRVKVGEYDDEGNSIEPLPGRKFLRESVELNPGDWFSRSTIAENLQTITRYYRDEGYAKVQVSPQTELNPEERIVHLSIGVRRGPLVYVQRINFAGNTKTRDAVMRRELRIAEGDLYSQSLVELSKERVNALGFFESVDVAEEPGSADDRIVLSFQVAERPTGTFQLGAGFSSQETFLLTGQIQQQNLFGRGQSLSLNLQFSGIRQLGQVRFVEPYLYGSDWTMAIDLFKMLRQQRSFDRDSTGFNITLGHPIFPQFFDDRLRLFASYHLEHVQISAASGGVFGTGRGQNFGLFNPLPVANLFRTGLTSSLRLSLQWDSRDNRLFPTKGVFATVSTEVADKTVLQSQIDFVRHRVNARFYYPLFWKVVAKLNTEWGLITSNSKNGVPVFERYFLGGIQDVRGFLIQAVGPRIGLPTEYNPLAPPPSRGLSFGGNMQAYYNLEVEFPIVEAVGIKGVIFQDAGNAWNLEDRLCGPDANFKDPAASSCGWDLLQVRTAWGFGFRWFSPLGPLRFEWGFPFKPRKPYEDDFQFMFTVGNAF